VSDAADRLARRAASFGAAADLYERARPGYPEAALDWVLAEGASVVLDLGAGTGKLTRRLLERGLEVIAVEPSGEMLAQLRRHAPDARPLAGRAEAIPLPDESVDAVLVAQAWHWVDVEPASREVARVLRPGGTLGLIWNTRDVSVGWTAEYGRIIEGGSDHMDQGAPTVGPPFRALEHHEVRWSQPTTPEGLVELAASRSYLITAPPAEQEAILEAVRGLTRTHPELAGRTELELPYVTECFRTLRPART
jgi:SAM-dependent methyltransferase